MRAPTNTFGLVGSVATVIGFPADWACRVHRKLLSLLNLLVVYHLFAARNFQMSRETYLTYNIVMFFIDNDLLINDKYRGKLLRTLTM